MIAEDRNTNTTVTLKAEYVSEVLLPKPKYITTEITYGKKHKEKASTAYTNVVRDFLYFAAFIADLPNYVLLCCLGFASDGDKYFDKP